MTFKCHNTSPLGLQIAALMQRVQRIHEQCAAVARRWSDLPNPQYRIRAEHLAGPICGIQFEKRPSGAEWILNTDRDGIIFLAPSRREWQRKHSEIIKDWCSITDTITNDDLNTLIGLKSGYRISGTYCGRPSMLITRHHFIFDIHDEWALQLLRHCPPDLHETLTSEHLRLAAEC